MINKHEYIYYKPLVGSIRMGKNILRTRDHRLNHISFYVYLAGMISCASVTQLNAHWWLSPLPQANIGDDVRPSTYSAFRLLQNSH